MDNISYKVYTKCSKCNKAIKDEKPILSNGELTSGGTIVFKYICFECYAKEFNSEEEAMRKLSSNGHGGIHYYA